MRFRPAARTADLGHHELEPTVERARDEPWRTSEVRVGTTLWSACAGRCPDVTGRGPGPVGSRRPPVDPGGGQRRTVPPMETQSTDVTIGDRRCVYTRPAGAGRWPGVVMLHEAFGINDVLRRQADAAGLGGIPGGRPGPARRGVAVRLHEARLPVTDLPPGPTLRGDLRSPDLAGRPAGVQRQGRRDRLLHGWRLRAGGGLRRVRRRLGELRDDPRRRRPGAARRAVRSWAATAARTG